MGKKDAVTKDYIRDMRVFADAFNYFIYNGEQVIDSENLHEMDTTAIGIPYGTEGVSVPVQKYRDVFRYLAAMTDNQTAYLLLGIELQSNSHYAMPVKAELYDALEYARQVEAIARKHREDMKAQKKDKCTNKGKNTKEKRQQPTQDEYLSGFWKGDTLVPVITLVIFFSSEKWEGPLSLHDMFSIQNEKILSLVPNYRVNFIAPASMTEEEIDKFRSSLREVMLYIKHSKDKEKLISLVSADERFKNLDRKAVEVITEVTHTRLKFGNEENDEKEEKCNMCKAIDDLCEEVADNTRLEAIRNLMESLESSAEQAMQMLKIPEEAFGKYLSMLKEQ
ncbi:MAG: transposase [Eubacteriales bacterium]|nr:transposase [Eubacteriales bacterium]